jgi:hypothetical protein
VGIIRSILPDEAEIDATLSETVFHRCSEHQFMPVNLALLCVGFRQMKISRPPIQHAGFS